MDTALVVELKRTFRPSGSLGLKLVGSRFDLPQHPTFRTCFTYELVLNSHVRYERRRYKLFKEQNQHGLAGMGYAINEAATRRLLLEEIERIVADAAKTGIILHTGDMAARLAETYPGTNFSMGRIIDEIIASASASKVAIEITRTDRRALDVPVSPSVVSGGQSAIARSLARQRMTAARSTKER